MTDETRQRLESMSKSAKGKRLGELNYKLGIVQPKPLASDPPQPTSLEDMEEREWLKKDLGYC
jgi:hypothetical protein